MIRPDSEYKRSLFDRMGGEAADVFRVANWAIVPTVAGAFIGIGLVLKRGLPPNHKLTLLLLFVGGLLGAVIVGGTSVLFMWGVSRGAGEGLGAFIQPKGDYERDYSREDSLVARGDVDGALASFATIAAEEPDNLAVRLRAAELHRKQSAFDKSAALYREVQGKAQRKRDDVHASLRLIDLYLAWPEKEGKAMSELRRLMDRYPGGEIEKRSKETLARLKSERFPAAE